VHKLETCKKLPGNNRFQRELCLDGIKQCGKCWSKPLARATSNYVQGVVGTATVLLSGIAAAVVVLIWLAMPETRLRREG